MPKPWQRSTLDSQRSPVLSDTAVSELTSTRARKRKLLLPALQRTLLDLGHLLCVMPEDGAHLFQGVLSQYSARSHLLEL